MIVQQGSGPPVLPLDPHMTYLCEACVSDGQPCLTLKVLGKLHVRIQREIGGPDPLKNHKFIGFPSNTGQDPLKITKLPSQHSMVGHYWPASETPFQLRLLASRKIARFWWSLEPCSPKKTYYSWTPSGKTFWIRA